MKIDFHRNFNKTFTKLNKKQKDKFKEQLKIFVVDPYNIQLNNHGLQGKYQGYKSINITGNIRAIFIYHQKNHIEFIYIGTHSQLYK